MAKQTKPIITQEKETETKEIKLDFLMMCRRRAEIYKREERAREYISQCRKREREKYERISVVVIALLVVAFLIGIATIPNTDAEAMETQDNLYTMRGELQGNHVVLEDGNVHKVDKTEANYTSETRKVIVILNDKGTEEVTDDIIHDIRLDIQ